MYRQDNPTARSGLRGRLMECGRAVKTRIENVSECVECHCSGHPGSEHRENSAIAPTRSHTRLHTDTHGAHTRTEYQSRGNIDQPGTSCTSTGQRKGCKTQQHKLYMYSTQWWSKLHRQDRVEAIHPHCSGLDNSICIQASARWRRTERRDNAKGGEIEKNRRNKERERHRNEKRKRRERAFE